MGKMINDYKGGKDLKGIRAELCGDKVVPLEDITNHRMQGKLKASIKILLIHS